MQSLNPNLLKPFPEYGTCCPLSYLVAKRPLAGSVRNVGLEMPAQVPSSSSDRNSILRAPSKNSHLAASKRECKVYETKLNNTKLIQTFNGAKLAIDL
ncbi:hypothetical protein AVEN_183709-1 [Araneus ventricosus]|uniref:Uncharacterized protein n=1 Tax=Araneus ventricosus TaxID=182803 RepID=A0A4Y2SWT8_ARAVE|nr:hypothetical protein AVEN_183709-1 [Araneus ventricosus]